MTRFLLRLLVVAPFPTGAVALFVNCSDSNDTPSHVDASAIETSLADASASDAPNVNEAGNCAAGYDDAGAPLDLRCTGLYSDWNSKTIASDVHAYDPGLRLWSDGANKSRFIYLPPGTKIDTSNMDEWRFPVGTKLWKEFVVGGKRIETRLLWKQDSDDWYKTTYRWSADESHTTELLTGELNVNDAGYEVPSQAACNVCHRGRQDIILGFEAVSLSSSAASGFTMSDLTSANLLTMPPASPIVVPSGDGGAQDALGYLHANCGTACHNKSSNATALNSGFFMRLDVATLGSVSSTDAYTTGVNLAAKFYVQDAGPFDRIKPCDPVHSAVVYRMAHRDGTDAGAVQMPPIDSHQVDSNGLAIVTSWVNQLCH